LQILLSSKGDVLHLRYQLLNPSDAFSAFAEARSVVIAGGTMAPLSDFGQQLLSYLSEDHIKPLACAHVVPAAHVLARAVAMGPSGHKLEFKYEQRKDTKMLDEYGAAILNLVNLVSKGLVVFVPSYASLDLFLQRWEGSGILARMKQKKPVCIFLVFCPARKVLSLSIW
jgi:chromosome transmission fidelity protein 1